MSFMHGFEAQFSHVVNAFSKLSIEGASAFELWCQCSSGCKAYILARLQRESEILSEKARFIKLVLKGDLKVKRRNVSG